VGILSTPPESLTLAARRRRIGDRPIRLALRAATVVAVALAVLPPLGAAARRYDVYESVQFALVALVAPTALALGAPLASAEGSRRVRGSRLALRVVARAQARRRHRGIAGALPALSCYLLGLVLWRTPSAVDALQRRPLLLAAELATFLVVGWAYFSELVASPPFVPRATPTWRIALAVPAMWTTWLLAYLVAFTTGAWFPAYRHEHGVIILAADQQLSAGALWAFSTAVFLPIIFLNLTRFLSDEEDLDHELDRVLRAERRGTSPARRADLWEVRRRGDRWRSASGSSLHGGTGDEPGSSP
jgi:cytochrome c oxidase assembly factor CtaG